MMLGAMASEREFESPIAWFAAQGIPQEMLQFHLGVKLDDYLRLHHQVDICLDPFPFTGATTTGHALWMGVPTLTLEGRTTAGRLGPAMLRHVGLEDFVAHNHDDFVAKGLHWAKDLELLAKLRSGLRDRFQQSSLGQPATVAQGLAEAFRNMWRARCSQI